MLSTFDELWRELGKPGVIILFGYNTDTHTHCRIDRTLLFRSSSSDGGASTAQIPGSIPNPRSYLSFFASLAASLALCFSCALFTWTTKPLKTMRWLTCVGGRRGVRENVCCVRIEPGT